MAETNLICLEKMPTFQNEREKPIGPSREEFYFVDVSLLEIFDMEVLVQVIEKGNLMQNYLKKEDLEENKEYLIQSLEKSVTKFGLSTVAVLDHGMLCECCGFFHRGECPTPHLCERCGLTYIDGYLHRCPPITRCPEHHICKHNLIFCQCFKCWGQPAQCPYYND